MDIVDLLNPGPIVRQYITDAKKVELVACRHIFTKGKRKGALCLGNGDPCILHRKCPHGKRKQVCIRCGGSEICMHRKRKSKCKSCKKVCIHNKLTGKCITCNRCIHGNSIHYCVQCNNKRLCDHGRHSLLCGECRSFSSNEIYSYIKKFNSELELMIAKELREII
jgi:hypothetical protein